MLQLNFIKDRIEDIQIDLFYDTLSQFYEKDEKYFLHLYWEILNNK